ncbi:hypothetical protein FMEAI12_3430027 [Parafrankia sp. Ea1.12]|nr:hypothetical protein FMEAI12_3430027 [Parafrankia sp. Ea1.12]
MARTPWRPARRRPVIFRPPLPRRAPRRADALGGGRTGVDTGLTAGIDSAAGVDTDERQAEARGGGQRQ